MDNNSFYHPAEIAHRKGLWRRIRLGLTAGLATLVLAGFATCFLVPQARISSFVVTSHLFGLAPDGHESSQRPLTREMILEGMGAKGSEYCMFTSAKTLEENLSQAWFVAPSPAPEVEIGPFSCRLSFQDVYPLAEVRDASGSLGCYLSSGASYESAAPELKAAYPDLTGFNLVAVPSGTINGYDYAVGDALTQTLLNLAPIDPSILASTYLEGALESEGQLYLYVAFPEVANGARIRLAPADLDKLDGEVMLGSIGQALESLDPAAGQHLPTRDALDSWTQGNYFQLRFVEIDSGRYGVIWDDGEE